MDALKHGAGDEALDHLPKSASEIALWKLGHPRKDDDENVEADSWIRLEDEKSSGEKLGLQVASL